MDTLLYQQMFSAFILKQVSVWEKPSQTNEIMIHCLISSPPKTCVKATLWWWGGWNLSQLPSVCTAWTSWPGPTCRDRQLLTPEANLESLVHLSTKMPLWSVEGVGGPPGESVRQQWRPNVAIKNEETFKWGDIFFFNSTNWGSLKTETRDKYYFYEKGWI